MSDVSGATGSPTGTAGPTPATPSPDATGGSTCQHCGLPILAMAYGLPGGHGARKKKWTHANGLRSCVTAKGMRTVATPVEATS